MTMPAENRSRVVTPDVVIPVRPGNSNPELRYALRSLANVPHGAVHIVGHAPRWVNRKAVNVIPRPLIGPGTVRDHMRVVCESPDVSESFLLFNDDMYVTRPVPIPVLNRGRQGDVIARLRARHGVSMYVLGMIDTLNALSAAGFPDPWCFELHTPMRMQKDLLREALILGRGVRRFNWRTGYGAVAGLSGDTVPDVKVYERTDPIPPGPFLSTSDQSFPWFADHLAGIFPKQSRYER